MRDKTEDRGDESRSRCIAAIQACAAHVGEPLQIDEYRQWRDDQPGWRPSAETIQQLEGWMALCKDAGVETAGYGPPSRSREEFLAALTRLRDGLGDWPAQGQYIEYKRRSAPSHTWPYNQSEQFDGWQDAIDAARKEHDEPDIPDAARHCRDCGATFVAHWDEPLCGGCRDG